MQNFQNKSKFLLLYMRGIGSSSIRIISRSNIWFEIDVNFNNLAFLTATRLESVKLSPLHF